MVFSVVVFELFFHLEKVSLWYVCELASYWCGDRHPQQNRKLVFSYKGHQSTVVFREAVSFWKVL